MNELNINGTIVLSKNLKALNDKDKRFIVNVGGTRSSKTYSLCQLMIIYCLTNPGSIVSVVRKTFPALRASVMRDMISILQDMDLYRDEYHNKTEHIYEFPNKSIIEFFSIDDEQKVRGRKRDILWANEANELGFDDFNQLNFRTTSKLFFDYNPSDISHWIDDIIIKPDGVKIHSTYKDNQFLEDSIVKQIEDLINVDYEYYKIYCLGEKATAKSTIYTHQKDFDKYPEKITDYCFSIDWGYNHPTAMVKVSIMENKLYVEEFIYQSYMTSSDVIQRLSELSISKSDSIICDGARPEMIEDLRRAGYNARPAVKNIKEGIDIIKSSELYIHKNSTNIWKEIKMYKWKTNGDRILDEPIKMSDDAMDAMRYGALYLKKNNNNTLSSSSFASFKY